MGRGGTPAREIRFVSLVAYGPNSDSALTMGVTASETRQGGSQHRITRENRIPVTILQGNKVILRVFFSQREIYKFTCNTAKFMYYIEKFT